MDVLNGVIMAAAAIITLAVMTFAVGTLITGLPAFAGGSDAPALMRQGWNATMINVSSNSAAAFQLISISPLALGSALVISIIIGAFVIFRR